MPSLTYRAADEADVAAVVDLVHLAYRGTSPAGWTSEADLLGGQRVDASMIRKLLVDPGAQVLLAFDGRTLVACCELRVTDGVVGYFGMFAVRPGLQGGGLGRAVLAEAERIALSLGADTLEMTVIRQRESLIAWYERRGYTLTGETRPFPYGDERFGMPRRNDLEFVTLAKSLA